MQKNFQIILFIVVSLGLSTAVKAGENQVADKWYSKVRTGVFYHWGLYTGGGSSTTGSKNLPFYKTVADFEKAAGTPEKFALNIIKLTKSMGAGYMTITLFHTCDKHMVIFPTENPAFKFKTKQDYLGALIKEAHKNGIKIIAYYPAHADHYKGSDGVYLNGFNGVPLSPEGEKFWAKVMRAFFKELKERYGENSIDGFWMDGYMSWQPVIDSFPNALRIGNNQVRFHLNPPPHISTTEFLTGKCNPAYNRPSALVKPLTEWGDDNLVPRKDFNEDIPTCNGWWYHGGRTDNNYTKDPVFVIKQMLCSLGVRRKWNFTLGVGPLVNGIVPPEFKPMVKKLGGFMKWARPAIYDTVGGEDAPIQGGWLNSGAFAVVMVDKKEKDTYYLCVLEPPTVHTKKDIKIQHDWVTVKSITDLRTGKPAVYDVKGSINIYNVDWSDIKDYGAKIFKIVIASKNK